jgi:lipid-A-disaccharide synthase-like uncharacterized protein
MALESLTSDTFFLEKVTILELQKLHCNEIWGYIELLGYIGRVMFTIELCLLYIIFIDVHEEMMHANYMYLGSWYIKCLFIN